MSLILVLSLLICISVHACNARYLGLVFDKEAKGSLDAKDLGEKVPDKTLLPSELVPPELVENGAHRGRKVGRDILNNYGSLLGAKTMELKAEKDSLNERGQSRILETSGTEVMVSRSSPYDMQEAAKIKISKNQVRCMLGFAGGDALEAAESKENEIAEDITEMDYAQPHRKPPIHNEKN